MAVDTRDKRASVVQFCLCYRQEMPLPDGTVSTADRWHLALCYRAFATLATAFHISDVSGTVSDIVDDADLDYNNGYNLATGSLGYGYDGFLISGTPSPGANDVAVDSGFADSTRSLPSFDTDPTGLNNAAGSAWADTTAYAVGDIVSSSETGVWNGDTINYRCITAHTSAAGHATNGKPYASGVTDWRTNWEFATLYRLRQDVSKIPRLIAWLKDGFMPSHGSVIAGGHDGFNIGAVESAHDYRLDPTLCEMLQGLMA